MTDPDAPAQLFPGPCILMEYRNRGLGALYCFVLRYGICEMPGSIEPAPKPERTHQLPLFVSKFGGQSSLIEPLLAA